MKKMITILVASILLLVTNTGISQHTIAMPLQIGQKLPQYLMTYIYEAAGLEADLFSGKKKLIILDFWNKSCKASIASLPKMDSLQAAFKDAIQVVLITTMPVSEARLFLPGKVNLPGIAGDTILVKYFPHTGVPHHVWISQEGIIEYITFAYNANQKNIAAFLDGNKPVLSLKRQEEVDPSKPLWSKENDLYSKYIRYYSYMAGWLEGYAVGGIKKIYDPSRRVIGLRFTNQSVLSLYQIALGDGNDEPFRYEKLVDADTSALSLLKNSDGESMDEWNRENLVSYEIAVPLSQKENLYQLMKQDLDRYFDFEATVIERPVNSLCLVRTSGIDKIKGDPTQLRKIVSTERMLEITNADLDYSLIVKLRTANASIQTPIFNKTGLSGKVTLKLNCSLNDIPSLKRELRKYDLDLVEQIVSLKILVIKKKIPAM